MYYFYWTIVHCGSTPLLLHWEGAEKFLTPSKFGDWTFGSKKDREIFSTLSYKKEAFFSLEVKRFLFTVK